MANFGQSAKGGPFAKMSKLAIHPYWLSNGNCSKGYSKWPILAKVQRGDPLQKSQNWPFYWPKFKRL